MCFLSGEKSQMPHVELNLQAIKVQVRFLAPPSGHSDNGLQAGASTGEQDAEELHNFLDYKPIPPSSGCFYLKKQSTSMTNKIKAGEEWAD